jgi:SPP1 family predicted phage head-tail adaptor
MKDLTSRLRRRIIIEQLVEQSDDNGGLNIKWDQLIEVFAEVKAISDYRYSNIETPLSMQLITSSPYLFVIRYIAGLNNKMRISYDGRYFNIRRLINYEERNAIWHIITEEELV